MTTQEVDELFNKYREYFQLAEKYYTETTGDKFPNIRLDEYGNIQHEVNEACGCHPEYHWVIYANNETICDWIKTQTK